MNDFEKGKHKRWVFLAHVTAILTLAVMSAQTAAIADSLLPQDNPASMPDVSPSFTKGLTDRTHWESWVKGLSPDQHNGAVFWAYQRGLPNYVNCNSSGFTAQFWQGCVDAKSLLDQYDFRRKADPNYRAGWNAYRD